MKKIIFSIVGSLVISLCAVQAQERDTTGMASKSRNKQNKQRYEQSQQRDQRGRQQQQAWQQQDDSQNAYANEGMVIIEKEEIPSSLKQTLQKEKYAGWENATIYHNTNTGEYVIAPRAYRFDEQGKEIEVGNAGYGSRDGNQNRYSGDRSSGQNMQDSPERTAQTQQGQDPRGENSTYSSRNQSDKNKEYKSNKSETKRNQTSKTQPQSYDQAQRNQQPRDDESSNDQSSQNQQETADQSTQSQDQSNTYTRDQSNQNQRNGQQQPSTGYRSGQNDQSNVNDESQPGQSSQSYRTEDMTEVQPDQIPATLRRTLSERQYSGWEENGKLYKDPATNEYVLVMEKQDDSSQPQAYRFDKNGQLKDDQTSSTDQNKTGSQNGASQRNNGQ